MQDRILVVDDDRQLTDFLMRFFEKYGFAVATAGTGAEMRERLASDSFSLLILDLILPDEDGFELARELRRTTDMPIIMLTARGEVYDRVMGLELGADDYLTKPYAPHELLARVRSVLRRTQGMLRADGGGGQTPRAPRLRFAGFVLDPVEMHLCHSTSGKPVGLTATEFAILQTLAENNSEVLSRERLLATVRGRAGAVTDRAIDAHIARLRRKIDPSDSNSSLIRTVHRMGYVLAAEVTRDED